MEASFVAVVSDTHLHHGDDLPPALLAALAGAELILHAGDVVDAAVLEALAAVAPLCAVRGNMDPWALAAAGIQRVPFREGDILMAHRLEELHGRLAREAPAAVLVHGHTHRPEVRRDGSLLVVNPGSPTQPRGGHPPSFARLERDAAGWRARIVSLRD